MTPLRRTRLAKGWSLEEVSRKLRSAGFPIDTGNLSRVERAKQGASLKLAESLVGVFGRRSITEMHILYPERYMDDAA